MNDVRPVCLPYDDRAVADARSMVIDYDIEAATTQSEENNFFPNIPNRSISPKGSRDTDETSLGLPMTPGGHFVIFSEEDLSITRETSYMIQERIDSSAKSVRGSNLDAEIELGVSEFSLRVLLKAFVS